MFPSSATTILLWTSTCPNHSPRRRRGLPTSLPIFSPLRSSLSFPLSGELELLQVGHRRGKFPVPLECVFLLVGFLRLLSGGRCVTRRRFVSKAVVSLAGQRSSPESDQWTRRHGGRVCLTYGRPKTSGAVGVCEVALPQETPTPVKLPGVGLGRRQVWFPPGVQGLPLGDHRRRGSRKIRRGGRVGLRRWSLEQPRHHVG